MHIKTAITNIHEGKEIIRGHELTELIRERSFTESICLLLLGELPTQAQKEMFDAIFTAIIDHGPGTPSALCARISASAKNDMHTALAAGVLGFGERHGVALEAAMQFFYAHKNESDLPALLADMKARKAYVPGYGHKILSVDPRAHALLEKAQILGLAGAHCAFAERVHEALNATASKPLPLNVDGAIAAVLCDMGVDARLGKGLFVIGRMPGLVAQVYEETTKDEGLRRLSEDEVVFMSAAEV